MSRQEKWIDIISKIDITNFYGLFYFAIYEIGKGEVLKTTEKNPLQSISTYRSEKTDTRLGSQD